MKKIITVLLVASALIACSSLGSHISNNRKNLQRIEYGMTKAQVQEIMGAESVRSFNNPYRAAMQRRGDTLIEISYYWTDGSQENGVEDRELSPVVFENGKVVGTGREFWTEFVQKYELRMR